MLSRVARISTNYLPRMMAQSLMLYHNSGPVYGQEFKTPKEIEAWVEKMSPQELVANSDAIVEAMKRVMPKEVGAQFEENVEGLKRSAGGRKQEHGSPLNALLNDILGETNPDMVASKVQNFVQSGGDVNQNFSIMRNGEAFQTTLFNTLLAMEGYYGGYDIPKSLVEMVDLTLQDQEGRNGALMAARMGRFDVLDAIPKHSDNLWSGCDHDGRTVAHYVCLYGGDTTYNILELLEHMDWSVKDNNGYSAYDLLNLPWDEAIAEVERTLQEVGVNVHRPKTATYNLEKKPGESWSLLNEMMSNRLSLREIAEDLWYYIKPASNMAAAKERSESTEKIATSNTSSSLPGELEAVISEMNIPDYYGRTSWHYAAIFGNSEAYIALQKQGAKPLEDKYGLQPMDYVLMTNKRDLSREFVEEALVQTGQGRNLVPEIIVNRLQNYSALLEHIETQPHGPLVETLFTAMREANGGEHIKSIIDRFAAMSGSSFNDDIVCIKGDGAGLLRTPLFNAVVAMEGLIPGWYDTPKYLLTQGYDIDVSRRDCEGKTGLITAAKMGRFDLVNTILNFQNDPSLLNAQDYDGNTALHYARLYGDAKTADRLVSMGADVTVRNREYYTPNGLMKLAPEDAVALIEETLRSIEIDPERSQLARHNRDVAFGAKLIDSIMDARSAALGEQRAY